jgi:hypothetical protein
VSYLSGKAGRAAYEAARPAPRKAADPQSNVTGGAAALAAVAAYQERCTCGEPAIVHELNVSGKRTFCTFMTGAGRCGCDRFIPAVT